MLLLPDNVPACADLLVEYQEPVTSVPVVPIDRNRCQASGKEAYYLGDKKYGVWTRNRRQSQFGVT